MLEVVIPNEYEMLKYTHEMSKCFTNMLEREEQNQRTVKKHINDIYYILSHILCQWHSYFPYLYLFIGTIGRSKNFSIRKLFDKCLLVMHYFYIYKKNTLLYNESYQAKIFIHFLSSYLLKISDCLSNVINYSNSL